MAEPYAIDLTVDEAGVSGDRQGPVRHQKETKVSKKAQRSYRAWTWTDFKMMNSIDDQMKNERVRFIEWANEIAPETKAKHRQAWGQFLQGVTMGQVQKMVGYKCHCEPVKDPVGCHYYCSTQDQEGSGFNTKLKDPEKPQLGLQEYFGEQATWHETRGTQVKQGSRSDIHDLYQSLKEGKSVLECFEEHTEPMFKYIRAATDLRKELDKKDKPKFERKLVHVWCGPPGTGKSHKADCVHGEELVYHLGKTQYQTKFWEGYSGEQIVCLDGFDGSWMTFQELEHLLDGYAQTVNLKGTSRWGRIKHVYITSNLKPMEWYPNVFKGEQGKIFYKALVGRIMDYHWLDEPYVCRHNRVIR